MQHGTWPNAARSESEPTKLKGAADYHNRETGDGEGFWGAGVVISKKQEGIMPDCPDASADEAADTPAESTGEPREQEAAPADLFAESAGHAADDAEGGEDGNAEQKCCDGGRRRKGVGNALLNGERPERE